MSSRLPGVISTVSVNPLLTSGITSIRKPIILGVGDIKVLVENEKVIRGSAIGGADRLTDAIYGTSDAERLANIIRIGNSPNSSDYIRTHEYIVTTATSGAEAGIPKIDWSPGPEDSTDEPAVGGEYYVTYYKDISNFDLAEYTSPFDVKQAHGSEVMNDSYTYSVVTSAASGSSAYTTFTWSVPTTNFSISSASDWTVTFVSGENTGVTRTLQSYSSGTFTVSAPFPNVIQAYSSSYAGDIFLIQNAESPVVNTLTAGSLLALQNGAQSVIVGQLDSSGFSSPIIPSASEYNTALNTHLETLKTYLDVPYYLVGMIPDNSTTITTNADANTYINSPIWNHCKLMSAPENKGERTTIAGFLAGTIKSNFKSYATTYFSTRMIVVAPGDVEYNNVAGKTVNGSLAAAALAGKVCSYTRVSQSVLNETLTGIDLAANFYNPIEQRDLTGAGVTFLLSNFGIIRIIAGKTTDTSTADTEDIAVVAIADYTKKVTREELNNTFISPAGSTPINNRLLNAMVGKMRSIFDRLVLEQVLEAYKPESITARQDITEPRLVRVTGSIKPLYSLWWVDVFMDFYV